MHRPYRLLAFVAIAIVPSVPAQIPAWIAPISNRSVDLVAPPCPIIRRAFTLSAKPAEARVRVVGLGHFELRCNGRVVGDTVANQPWSQYDKTLYVQEFDLAPALRSGENVLAVRLGNSFWCVDPPTDARRYAKTDAMPDFSRGRRHLLWLEATMHTADRSERIVSDDSWRWTDGPLTFSNIYAGEDFDARLDPQGWDSPGFDATAWTPVAIADAPKAELVLQKSPGLKTYETFAATEIREPEPGVYTYVFPQNCSAFLRFVVDGAGGTRVRFKPCEYMDQHGKVKFTYTWGTGKDIWHDYTLRGRGNETHQTLFCYVGCQYVELTGAVPAGKPNPAGLPVVRSLELVQVNAATPPVGAFACSSELQNAAHGMIDWTIRSNFSHVATDCPHREKNGWQEQNWHMARALSYRYDTAAYMAKICRDIRDAQDSDGFIPTNCPKYLVGRPPHDMYNDAPEWGVAGILVPWHLYEWYADRETLATAFESMKRYVAYLGTTAKDGVIRSNLGDWYDYGHGKGDGPSQWTPNDVSATAIWALAADTLARAADVLGKSEDATAQRALFERIRADFQRKFYDSGSATVRNNGSCQAGTAAALCIGLIPEGDRERALNAIVADLEKRGWQQTTGEVSHIFLIRALASAGRHDVLHRVYSREERGSYGCMVKSGLTTLPESWDAKPGTGNSMNHFMLGHLVEWHFAYVAGIRQQPGSAGWKRVMIAPRPGPLDSIDASFDSPAGRIEVHGRRREGHFACDIIIPDGVDSARAELPDGRQVELPRGRSKVVLN
jgi:alpha-L-rhamnosidase